MAGEIYTSWRSRFSENLKGIKTIMTPRRTDGTTAGMHSVDGYYVVKGQIIRQIREYDVKTMEEANERAKADGLGRGIMIEQYLSEWQPCVLDHIFGGKR
ncbi:MAG: hypothetical protein AABY15_08225 [Nanoarchaeota archaeon]